MNSDVTAGQPGVYSEARGGNTPSPSLVSGGGGVVVGETRDIRTDSKAVHFPITKRKIHSVGSQYTVCTVNFVDVATFSMYIRSVSQTAYHRGPHRIFDSTLIVRPRFDQHRHSGSASTGLLSTKQSSFLQQKHRVIKTLSAGYWAWRR